MGAIGAIGSAVGAISSIIGNFQMGRMEGSLNAIEANTRYSMIALTNWNESGISYNSNRTARGLELIQEWIWGTFMPALQSLMTTTESLVDKGMFWDYVNPKLDAIKTALADDIGPSIDGVAESIKDASRDITITLEVDGEVLSKIVATEVAGQLAAQGVPA